jgi:hypothetical protein
MASLPPKKGPRMTRSASEKNVAHDELERSDVKAQLEASARKAFSVIQEARSKMAPEQREKVDREADAILENALRTAAKTRRRA